LQLWADDKNERYFGGRYFCPPEETLRLKNKRFFRNEVFSTCVTENFPLNRIVGRCVVMDIESFFLGLKNRIL
jgi:hypothetical protein